MRCIIAPLAEGKTPLHYAARDGLVACVEVLLKAGPKTDIEDYRGSAPQNSFASNSLVKKWRNIFSFLKFIFCIWRSEFSWVSLSNCVKKSDLAFAFCVLHQQGKFFLRMHYLFSVLNICSFLNQFILVIRKSHFLKNKIRKSHFLIESLIFLCCREYRGFGFRVRHF